MNWSRFSFKINCQEQGRPCCLLSFAPFGISLFGPCYTPALYDIYIYILCFIHLQVCNYLLGHNLFRAIGPCHTSETEAVPGASRWAGSTAPSSTKTGGSTPSGATAKASDAPQPRSEGALPEANRPFDLLVFPFRSIVSQG